MNESSKEAGVIQALVERLEKFRIPIALELKEKVGKGEPLNDLDIEFLEHVLEDASRVKPFVDEHPEWQDLAARIIHLYNEITEKALENEKSSSSQRD